MKKILMGLFAITATVFSAEIELGTAPQNETNIFQTGENGAIEVTGKITTDIPVTKYVVYTSPTGTLDGAEDILTLPTFVLSQKDSENVMDGTAQKIYVKKVADGNGGVEELTNENVEFLATGFDSFYTAHTGDVIKPGAYCTYPMTAFLNKTQLEEIANAAFGSEYSPVVSEYGVIKATIDGNVKVYRLPKRIHFKSETPGVMEVITVTDNDFTKEDTMAPEYAKKVEAQFATAKEGTVSVQVVIR